MATLVIHPPTSRPIRFWLDPGIYVVGRGSDNAIAIEDATLSEQHCELEIRQDGSMRVKDLGSSQGTCVDDDLVLEAEVRPGGVVRAGGVRMWIEVDPGRGREAAEEAPGPAAAPALKPTSFFAAVPGAFAYAAQGEFLLLIGAAAVLGSLQGLLPRGLSMVAIVPGFLLGVFLITVYRGMVVSTAEGHDRIPAMGWSMFHWDDMIELFARCALLTLICFGPSSAVLWWPGSPPGLRPLLFGLGCLYFPTAFLGMLLTDSLGAANPAVVLESLRRAPLANAFLAVTLAGLLGLSVYLEPAAQIPPDNRAWRLVTEGLLTVCVLYLSLVWMRWLGLYYRCEDTPDDESTDRTGTGVSQ